MTKHTVSLVRQELQEQKRQYEAIYDKLRDEQALAKQASAQALKEMDPLIAGFLMREIPSLTAPALGVFDDIFKGNAPSSETPSGLIIKRQRENIRTQEKITTIIEEHGTAGELAAKLADLQTQATLAGDARDTALGVVSDKNEILGPFDLASREVERKSGEVLKPSHLSAYRKEGNWFKHHWRNQFDTAYPLLMPVAEHYAANKTDLAAEIAARKAAQDLADVQHKLRSENLATQNNTADKRNELLDLTSRLRTEGQILAEVHQSIATAITQPAMFNAAEAAFGERFPAAARPLMQKAQVMSRLAAGLAPHKDEIKAVSDSLSGPLKKLDTAVRNRNGSKQITFDLTGKTQQMQRHRTLMTQRAFAARDVRTQASSTTTSTHDDGTNWLLWYLILSDNSPAQAAAPAFTSGGGGDFGGGGASGSWDGPVASNSYFRAEVLGVNGDDARRYGIMPEQLRIAPDVLGDLGVKFDVPAPTSGEFNTLSSSLGATDFGSAKLDFGNLSGGIEFDTRKLDLGGLSSLTSEISESVSSIGSSLSSSSYDSGSSSSWSSSSSSSSYDSGSSWSSSDSGSSFSSSSFD